ncbi:protein phosphatase [Streptomyces sp. 3MP-14]|uniref:Serine/threonine protein phosphatase PstP n=1 Tax=Streptomyces mimosae TaxID=2586635 RepID=A0A5N6A7F5_9ACTN|nr:MULTISPECIES: PP2C family serine/threonine-protein phosphatase [Streptomyces]KAB8163378.1 protein phosphatase [Streptomyces mimosae]KAB8174655.1 protein phosphatase [Streptomyces sp. 3MP-14]
MSLSLRFAAGSHVGMIRGHNEDSGYAGPRLLAIADGMGGQAAGEVASSEVISTLVPLDDDIPGSDLLTSLDASVQRANEQLRGMVADDPRLDGMGTTLTALLWTGQRMGVVHVGDSRAYLLRDGELTQITQDHTWVQRLVDEGRITEEEATTHPQRSLLMRALGSADRIEADLSIREVRPGDRYLLCSDGLSGVVSLETMRDAMVGNAAPADTVRELIELALRGGGPDNITCIIADVVDVDSQESDTLARQLSDAPQIVGAVAETQAQRSSGNPQTPAARAAELGRPQQQPTASAAPGPAGPATGVFGQLYPDDEYVQQRPRRPHPVRNWLLVALAVAVVGGGLYTGYRWTQTQYFVGVNGDHLALYQGLSQSLGPLDLSSVKEDHPEILVDSLPTYQQRNVQNDISADSLEDARAQIEALGAQAEVCELLAEQQQQQEEQQQGETGENGKEPEEPGAEPTTPELTDEQRELANRCAT